MTESATEERIEAVIISGPRKGEFITITNGEVEPDLTPQEEAMLDIVVANAKRLAENLRAARVEAEALVQEMREAREERHELLRTYRGDGQVDNDDGSGVATPA